MQRSLKVCADNPVAFAAYSEAARKAERIMDVMIESDTGQKRAGVETPAEVIALAQIINDDPMLEFAGLLFYPPIDGWAQTQEFWDQAKAGLASLGLSAKIVSTGGTPNLRNIGQLNGATEHRAGTCIWGCPS